MQLLRVLLEKKYGVQAQLRTAACRRERLARYDAVLLIGDEALRRNKYGLAGFDLVYDLAHEWYEWQKLPFVFAVWAVQKRSLPERTNAGLERNPWKLARACDEDFVAVAGAHGRRSD